MEDSRRGKKRKLEETSPSSDNNKVGEEQISLVYTGQPKDDFPEKVTHITVADSVAKIEENAFRQLRHLRDVRVASTVEMIGKYAFYHCRSLAKVHLQEGLKNIASCAFHGCMAL